jgi:hypothetical protein
MTSAVGVCYESRFPKMGYNEDDAISLSKKLRIYCYQCPECDNWHITKQKRDR